VWHPGAEARHEGRQDLRARPDRPPGRGGRLPVSSSSRWRKGVATRGTGRRRARLLRRGGPRSRPRESAVSAHACVRFGARFRSSVLTLNVHVGEPLSRAELIGAPHRHRLDVRGGRVAVAVEGDDVPAATDPCFFVSTPPIPGPVLRRITAFGASPSARDRQAGHEDHGESRGESHPTNAARPTAPTKSHGQKRNLVHVRTKREVPWVPGTSAVERRGETVAGVPELPPLRPRMLTPWLTRPPASSIARADAGNRVCQSKLRHHAPTRRSRRAR
jgi:hypothetical protein